MSVQFGRWNLDGKPLDPDYLENVKSVIAQYGPDGGASYTKADIGILYHSFHTTKESRRETQPHVSESGAIITWDGRLDNRAELIRRLADVRRLILRMYPSSPRPTNSGEGIVSPISSATGLSPFGIRRSTP